MDRAFRRAVLERLTVLDEIVEQPETDLPAPLARAELRRITGGWRDLLSQHQPDAAGRCPVCSGWLRRRKWPCQVWITAHQQLLGDTSDDQPGRAALGSAFRRPRDVEIVARQPDRAPGERAPGEHEAAQRTAPYVPASRAPLSDQDTARIHRAAVIERHPTMPRARFGRRSR